MFVVQGGKIMALIKCPECQNEVSDKATSCPHCGFPIHNVEENDNPEVVKESQEKSPKIKKEKRKGKIKVVVISLLLILIASLSAGAFFLYPKIKYEQAIVAENEGDYERAEEIYSSLGDYQDSAERAEYMAWVQTEIGSFLHNLKIGLSERWKISDSIDIYTAPVKNVQEMINKELDAIGRYKKIDFENNTFEKHVRAYITALENSYKAAESLSTLPSEGNKEWEDIYLLRIQELAFFQDYGLKMDNDEDQKTLDEIVKEAETHEDDQIVDNQLAAGFNNAIFEEYSGVVYIEIRNTTQYVLDYMYLDVSFQMDGTQVGEDTSNTVQNVSPAETMRFTVIPPRGKNWNYIEFTSDQGNQYDYVRK
jgi:hypothetical protein